MARIKAAMTNSISMIIYEIVGVICAFIVPKLILDKFGSDANGLVLAITRFLSISTIMDGGIGSVVRSTLYKPLANRDAAAVSRIYVSAHRFYKKVALIFAGYSVIIACVLPFLNSSGFDFWTVFQLTIIIAASTFMQFLIGAINTAVIISDQKAYLVTNINTVTLILNTIAVAVLIMCGFGIREVKLITSMLFIIRPVFAYYYCKRNYIIDKTITYDEDPIKQKRDGFGHQIANTVHANIGAVLLTVMSTYKSVSVYSVYALITEGLTKLISCVKTGMGPGFGNMLATENREKTIQAFSVFELLINAVSAILFSCAIVVTLPFVSVYTRNITDVEYLNPAFSAFMVIAAFLHNMKSPYNILIYAAGHFKQTKVSAYAEMIINIVASIILFSIYGLVGVALGTALAMLYRATYCAWYLSKNILSYPFKHFLTKLLLNAAITAAVYFTSKIWVSDVCASYREWFLVALETAAFSCALTLIIYGTIYKKECMSLIRYIRIAIKRNAGKQTHE